MMKKTKPLNSKLKTFAIYVVIGFLISMAIMVYDRFTHFEPLIKRSIDAKEIGASRTLSVRLRKDGCYEVGLSSYENIFIDYKIDGKYKLEYFFDGELFEEKVIEKNLFFGYYNRTEYTNTVLDVIEVPLKGHQKLDVKLTVLKPETMFLKEHDTVYMYINKSMATCGKEREEMLEKKHIENLTITTPEINETLKPLADALWDRALPKVQALIPSQFDVNARMVGERTPLHIAAYFDDIATIKYLVSQGAELDAWDVQKNTPLCLAIENNATKTVEYLLNQDINITRSQCYVGQLMTERRPALFQAACKERYEILTLMIESSKVDNNEMFREHNLLSYGPSCILPRLKDGKYDYLEQQEKKTKMEKFLVAYGFEDIYTGGPVQYAPSEPKKPTWREFLLNDPNKFQNNKNTQQGDE
jgi:hypothetical protein